MVRDKDVKRENQDFQGISRKLPTNQRSISQLSVLNSLERFFNVSDDFSHSQKLNFN